MPMSRISLTGIFHQRMQLGEISSTAEPDLNGDGVVNIFVNES